MAHSSSTNKRSGLEADLKIFAYDLEHTAKQQIDELVGTSAFSGARVRIMPDAHAGAGCVIGYTANMTDKVVPNLIGVDIGCGMLTTKLASADVDLSVLDAVVKRIPCGFRVHTKDTCDVSQLGLLCIDEIDNIKRQNKSLGTLGGGNHFIEAATDEDGSWYLIIHSGSRNLGLQVAEFYQAKADETCAEDMPRGLAYLTGELKEAYLHDMRICQQFARDNRKNMMHHIVTGIRGTELDSFHTVHNYVGDDDIIRKGAISAYVGEKVLIPFNMRDGSVIAIGKGNSDWNYSAPHGAGRSMSRSKARKTLSLSDYQKHMEGIYSSSVSNKTIDEAPLAYKPTQEILAALEPTVTIQKRLKPVYNFKAQD